MRIDVKDELWCSKSSRLKGKNILVLGTGSVALFKTPEFVRELIREGAEVKVMLSPDATKLVTPTVFEWASGNKVITEITGNVEHVLLAGKHTHSVDIILIMPLTATTLGKIVHGIADTNVTLTAMTAIGSKIPILLVPGMHQPMFENQFVKENLGKLKETPGITLLDPKIEEGKAKIVDIPIIVHWVIKILTEDKLKGKNVLVTGGPTKEAIDRVRYITNPSSGKMGQALALEAWYLGAHVDFIVGPNKLDDLSLFNTITINSAQEMADQVEQYIKTASIDIAIFSAAVGDYAPVKVLDKKIASGKPELKIDLKSTPKIIDMVNEIKNELNLDHLLIIGFKAEYNKSTDSLIKISRRYIAEHKADLMVANLIGTERSGFSVDSTDVFLVDKHSSKKLSGLKTQISQSIINWIQEHLK